MPLEELEAIFDKINFAAILFSFVFLIYWIYVFVIIYHLVRFGIGPKPKLFALIFLAGAVILFTTSIFSFGQIDFTDIFEKLKTKDFRTAPRFNIPTPLEIPVIEGLNHVPRLSLTGPTPFY